MSEVSQITIPALFIGHGSPMNALEDNRFTHEWSQRAGSLSKPKAIICISAHWETSNTQITAMEQPRTIHDIYGFPQALFQTHYLAPGEPKLAKELQQFLNNPEISLNYDWGLDHGSWSILSRMFPDADIPVLQISLDKTKPPTWHYAFGKSLQALRKQGILLIGSGNVVHNLAAINWNHNSHDWAVNFESQMKALITANDHQAIINYENLGSGTHLAVPTSEHFLPLLYILGLQDEGEVIGFFNEGITLGSISMLSFQVG